MLQVLVASEVTGLIQLGEMARDSIRVRLLSYISYTQTLNLLYLVFDAGG